MRTHQPVKDLQQMLRQISVASPQLPAVTPDGYFGERTLEAVMLFQRDSGLPVTGLVDRNTWRAIEDRCTVPLVCSSQHSTEDRSLMLYRLMFNALSRVICSFAPCEIHSPALTENLRLLQKLSGLNVTGSPDDDTWKHLFRLFRLYFLRNKPN